MGDISTLFTYFGLFVFLNQLRRVIVCFWFHFLRPDSYHKFFVNYQPGPLIAYALITGATDGIGKSLARVLYSKGFNLILHGRNEEKMKKVIEEIRALHDREGGEIEYFIADAAESNHDFEAIAKRFENLSIVLFINNVGGSVLEPKTIDRRSEDETRRMLNLNLNFPLFLTRAFLPQLRGGSRYTEVVFVGSFAGDSTLPFLCLYSSSKSFLKRAACILRAEERLFHGSDVLFSYLNVGEVRSSGLEGKSSLLRPSADDFAKAVVRSLGCGRGVVVLWYPHDVLAGILSLVPETLFERFARLKLAALMKDIVLEKDR